MGKILSLEPDGMEKRIHWRALERFNKFRAYVRIFVPLEDITEADLNDYLNDDEKAQYQSSIKQVTDGLKEFIDIGDSDSLEVKIKLLQYEVNSMLPMYQIQSFLEKVYKRKAEHIREQQQQKQQEEKRQAEEAEKEWKKKELDKKRSAAFASLNVPADAEKYLKYPEEHDEFARSINEAIHAYLAKGESYKLDSRATQYLLCIEKIEYRREKEQHKIVAGRKASAYNWSLNKEIARVKSELQQRKQNPEKLFEKDAADTRYTGQSFSLLLSKEEEKDFDRKIVDAGKKKVDEIVSGDFHKFIDGEYARTYFLLPWADYIVEGVPCLGFGFDVFAVVEVRVWLKPGRNNFDGYPFDLPWREGKGWSVSLRKREFLGYHYFVLTPEELGYSFWRDIPLSLVIGLMTGDKEPPGTDILQASDSETTYSVAGFDEKVTIPEVFASYLRKMEGVDGMFGLGVISDKVADVVDKKLTQLDADENGTPDRDSKKPGFEEADLIAALTNLGISTAEAEAVVPLVPRNLELKEAIRVAMQKLTEISSQNSSDKTE